jgi:hypothetical protein
VRGATWKDAWCACLACPFREADTLGLNHFSTWTRSKVAVRMPILRLSLPEDKRLGLCGWRMVRPEIPLPMSGSL